ncbi:MAG: hypothetical protein KKH70_12575, partial [Gammaproteobacteria bacterium]|nr:hypothetical protein [Gammaproteobacteria bacterium]
QPSAVRKCFLHFLALDTFFWRSKRKYLASGESFKAKNVAIKNSYCRVKQEVVNELRLSL